MSLHYPLPPFSFVFFFLYPLSYEPTSINTANTDRLPRRIESMKMETVIRSPQDGVIKRLAHKEGVSLVVLFFRSRFYTIGRQRAGEKRNLMLTRTTPG